MTKKTDANFFVRWWNFAKNKVVENPDAALLLLLASLLLNCYLIGHPWCIACVDWLVLKLQLGGL